MNFLAHCFSAPKAFNPTLARLAATGLIACSLASTATAAVVDLSGAAVDGGAPTDLGIALGAGTVASIDFDFSVEHFGFSWGRETTIEIIAPSLASYVFGGAFFGFGVGSGVFTFAGSAPIGPESALGNWTVRLTDSFNDSVNPDHVYEDGSFVRLVETTSVPEPGTIGLALGGLAGLALLRRRRRSE
ncbi:MAG: PEP-CTERM sorting domain-containing protein [Burkholderiaceae bacterium]|nr:PEP-CTERM sorting domain-containing protein [Burkholderiaceae bacterium]